ncbi:MAG: right-handed parallel beta-helix repeat-containing protein [Desmonostoc vinosum HA7617-LM4]|jgi:hypothetical protein|nr:right-handed parallel beta-helix repeat-containing protein [Desmonostoc vinosum HA7617-LM4]
MATFNVSNTNGSGSGSLQQAILDANALSGKDFINFNGVFADTIADTITLGGSSLIITDDLSIKGTGQKLLTVSGNNNSGVFEIDSTATVEIVGLTIANGNAVTGGGILNNGTLNIKNTTFSNNQASTGGGIFNNGTLNVNNTTITSNQADSIGGGGIFNSGNLSVGHTTISSNQADRGGGIYNEPDANRFITLEISNSSIQDNTAQDGGGVYYSALGESSENIARIINSTISSNSADSFGSGFYINGSSTTIVLNNSIISKNNGGSGLYNSNAIVVLNNSTISSNSGAGIYNSSSLVDSSLIINDSTISSNLGRGISNNSGNAIVNNSTISGNLSGGIGNLSGTLVVDGSTISNNSSENSGGGISDFSFGTSTVISNSTISGNSSGSSGGGIFGSDDLILINSTISGNSSKSEGGGIFAGDSSQLINTTISGNSANSYGGGIYIGGISSLTLSNSTITLNSSTNGGGIYSTTSSSSPIVVNNSLIAGNYDTTNPLNSDVAVALFSSRFSSNGFNLIGGNFDPSIGFNSSERLNVPITEVINLILRDNGGRVKTHALVVGSAAINTGRNADIPADITDVDEDGNTTERIPFDARGSGFARISGGRVDIGAYEAVVNVINGTPGRDTINGTAGNDIITGFQGADTLTGGVGADTFVYTNIRDTGDTITDFEVGSDKIVLQRRIFSNSGVNNINFDSAISGGYLRFQIDDRNTILLIDTDGFSGANRPIKFITLRNQSPAILNNAFNFAFLGVSNSTFTVTNTNDSGSGSLRQALSDANANAGKDIIKFDGVFADDIPDRVKGGLLIKDDLTIEGPGGKLLTIAGNIEISDGVTVEIEGLTIADSSSASPDDYFGGRAIYNFGTLTLSNITIRNNSTVGSGGAITNEGTLTINNSTISDNKARAAGGILNSGNLTVNNSTIAFNSGSNDFSFYRYANGIHNFGTATVNNSIIAGNYDIYDDSTGTTKTTFTDVIGDFTSNGSNIIGTLDGDNTGFNNSEQLNVPLNKVIDAILRDNGGTANTYALVTGSPAINAGNNADVPADTTDLDGDRNITEPIPFDGRGFGFARISGRRVDIGAYEVI